MAANLQSVPVLASLPRRAVSIDLVESVRLLLRNENDAVQRRRIFVDKVQAALPQVGGRVVKSLDDGLLAEFQMYRQLPFGRQHSFSQHRDEPRRDRADHR